MISSDVTSGTTLRSWLNRQCPLQVFIEPNSLIGFRGTGKLLSFSDEGLDVGFEGNSSSPWSLAIVFGAGASSAGVQRGDSIAVTLTTGAGVKCMLVGPEPPALPDGWTPSVDM